MIVNNIYCDICEIPLCLSCNNIENLICGGCYLFEYYRDYKNRVRPSNIGKRLYKKPCSKI